MAIDVGGKQFLAGGLHQRILKMCGGNEQAAKQWWDTPHPAFNLRTPRQLMDDDNWDTVREFIIGKANYPNARYDFGQNEKFYNKFGEEDKNYLRTDDAVEKFMASQKRTIVKNDGTDMY